MHSGSKQPHLYDFAIIGSGASGGRMARTLHESGAKCILLEAGRKFDRHTLPRTELEGSGQLYWGGGIEISRDGHLGFLRGKCVGGTTIVNQALLDRFDEDAFADWRDRSGVGFLSLEKLTPHYESVEKSISLQTIPQEHQNQNAKIFTQAFNDCGYDWKQLRRGQSNCNIDKGTDCITCLSGCRRDSKQSSWVTSIQNAIESGLALESEFFVHKIHHRKDQIKIQGIQNGAEQEIFCRKLILAGGAVGNSVLLLKSGFDKNLPAIGKEFSCHPQYMTYAEFEEPVDAHRGAFQSVSSHDLKLRRKGYKFENVFAPPIGTAMLFDGIGKKHAERMKRYRHYASMEICIRDEPVGRITLARDERPRIDKPLTDLDLEKRDEGFTIIRELFEAANAREVIQARQGFGLHLMGGCSIGVDSKESVFSPDFEMHDHPGIFSADSSIFPSAPGINPSLTIMALSDLAASKILGSS